MGGRRWWYRPSNSSGVRSGNCLTQWTPAGSGSWCRHARRSALELQPHGKLSITLVKANALKNMEMIGKSDSYTVVYVRPSFKVKTKVIDDNLNPVWDETFDLIAEDKETQSVIFEVFDKDITQDKRLGIAKLPLIELEPDKLKEHEIRLLPSLDMLKIKDKKNRGTLTVKILYHEFTKEEKLAALEEEKRILEERKKLKEAGVIGGTMDALGRSGSSFGSGIGLVVMSIGTVVGLVGSAIGAVVGLVGSGIGAGAGLVGSRVGAGVGIVGSGIGALGSGLTGAGNFVGKSTPSGGSSKKNGSSSPSMKGANAGS